MIILLGIIILMEDINVGKMDYGIKNVLLHIAILAIYLIIININVLLMFALKEKIKIFKQRIKQKIKRIIKKIIKMKLKKKIKQKAKMELKKKLAKKKFKKKISKLIKILTIRFIIIFLILP